MEATSASQDSERMKFTGQERDLMGTYSSQTDDLDNMHARSFNPNILRFLSADPLRGDPHRPQSFNLFAYVSGNPVNFVDPFGLIPGGGDSEYKDPAFDSYLADLLMFGLVVTTTTDYPPEFYGSFTWNPQTNHWDPGGWRIESVGVGSTSSHYYLFGGYGAIGTGTVLAPNLPIGTGTVLAPSISPPKQHRPCASHPGQGTDNTFLGTYHHLTYPLELMAVNGSIFVASGVQLYWGVMVAAAGCADPTPFELITCVAGVGAGATLVTSGAATAAVGYHVLKTYTWPAIKNWGC